MAAYFARNNGRDGRDRLAKIAEEGFALIDEGFYGGNRLHAAHFHQERQYGHRQYQNQQHYSSVCVYQYRGPQAVTVKQQPVLTSEYHADRPRQYFHCQDQHHQSHHLLHEPQVFTVKQQSVITSDEAAELFCGIAIVEHRANYGFK